MIGDKTSRRRYLKTAGALGLPAISGCLNRATGGADPDGPATTPRDTKVKSSTSREPSPTTETPANPEPGKLASDDGKARDRFGSAVALDGSTALVGANHDTNTNGELAGAVYVFEWTGEGWEQRTKLLAEDDTTTGFGDAIALEDNRALIGAPGVWPSDPSPVGTAYVFERDSGGWHQQASFSAYSEPSDDRNFGTAVALSGDTALIGEFWPLGSIGRGASTYVFERTGDTWERTTTLSPPGDLTMYQFGWAGLALRGDTAFVGATEHKEPSVTTQDGMPVGEYPNGHRTGSVFVFERSGGSWTRTARLTASDRAKSDTFGASIALSGETVVIGATGEETENGTEAGAVYVFQRDAGSWLQRAKLVGDRGAHERWTADHGFGEAVAAEGDTVLAGAPTEHDPNGVASGAVYEYTRTDAGWKQVTKRGAPDGDSGDGFGKAIAIDREIALVGAWRDEDPYGTSTEGEGPGSAYVLSRPV